MSNVVKTRTRVVCPDCLVSIKTYKTFRFQCGKCKRYFSVKQYTLKNAKFALEEQRTKFQPKIFNQYGLKHYDPLEDVKEEEGYAVTEVTGILT